MGSFDGLHEGHLELLRRVKSLATELGGESIVLTFDPHPRYVLGTGERMQLLTTLDEKLWLLERTGIDNVIVITFTREFSQLSAEEFVEQKLARIGVRSLVVGYNHRFGHKKEGDYDFLEAREGGFEVHMVEQQQIVGSKVSSTIIRQQLSRGMTSKAARLLGHPYVAMCDVRSGLATEIDEHKLLPPEGDYDVRVDGAERRLTIAANRHLRIDPAPVDGKVMIEFL